MKAEGSYAEKPRNGKRDEGIQSAVRKEKVGCERILILPPSPIG